MTEPRPVRLMDTETRHLLAANYDRAEVLRPAPSLVGKWVDGLHRDDAQVADLMARHILDLEAEVERLRAKAAPLNLAAVAAAQWGKTSAELDMERRPQGAVSPGDPDWVAGFGPVPGSGLS